MMIGKLCALALSLPAVASADPRETLRDLGTSVSVGGGFVQFVHAEARNYVTEGVGWEGRVAFGTKQELGMELGYLGTWHAVDAVGIDSSAALRGANVEGALRINFLTGALRPYAIGGVGLGRYSLTHTTTNSSTMGNTDTVSIFPLGLGVTFAEVGFVFDVRAVYRITSNVDMVSGTMPSLDTWGATLLIGFEY